MAAKKSRRRKPNTSPKATAKRLQTAEDVERSLRLRITGMSIRDIAQQVGKSIGWVSESVNRAIREVPYEAADEYRSHVIAREEAIIESHWERRSIPECARVIQTSDQFLARLLGLEAPKRSEVTGKDGGPLDLGGLSDEKIDAVIAALSTSGTNEGEATCGGDSGEGSEKEPA